ncbi:hypothetical protein BB558_000230 [Smittium angustum]|uniref:MARVEL domain-containing protein n=1 Tax=Smittium angustum TaxID=133377 RepID=A0A2U1JF15_SMIAN|nr:hypothetical protein BB558_000230 [Smittium angustum]
MFKGNKLKKFGKIGKKTKKQGENIKKQENASPLPEREHSHSDIELGASKDKKVERHSSHPPEPSISVNDVDIIDKPKKTKLRPVSSYLSPRPESIHGDNISPKTRNDEIKKRETISEKTDINKKEIVTAPENPVELKSEHLTEIDESRGSIVLGQVVNAPDYNLDEEKAEKHDFVLGTTKYRSYNIIFRLISFLCSLVFVGFMIAALSKNGEYSVEERKSTPILVLVIGISSLLFQGYIGFTLAVKNNYAKTEKESKKLILISDALFVVIWIAITVLVYTYPYCDISARGSGCWAYNKSGILAAISILIGLVLTGLDKMWISKEEYEEK